VESPTHKGGTESLSRTPPTTKSSSLGVQHQIKLHKRLWYFSLALVAILSVGSGIQVGILAHLVDLGMSTTAAVAAVVSCAEMYLTSTVE
jgi:hypothetical protein